MNYNLYLTSRFQKEAKKLNKKYPSFRRDMEDLFSKLEINPLQGDSLGKSCYKVRLKIESKSKGKSGGARVITHVHISNQTVFLLTIYDKSEKEALDKGELAALLAQMED